NQVLGTYNALDREMLLVASVRGVDSSGELREPPHRSQEHRDSVLAMQTLSFHQDDVDAFARLGWVGEGADGLLAAFELRKDGPEDLREFAERYGPAEFQSVLARVNNAREQVMARVVALNPDLTAADLPEVHRVFGRLNADNAPPGVKIQHPDGSWVVKP
ncbi:MAG TPA: DUF1318 domain-containing protein, partial [Deferrisomatales bacterium]|nr:DUF1318 domain-containing protein [Deferrisomatales bacterium]